MGYLKLVHFHALAINLVCIVLFASLINRAELVQHEDDAADTDGSAEGAGAAHIVYDQRQTGKYNIHVVIKDVAIIEMDQNEIQDVSVYPLKVAFLMVNYFYSPVTAMMITITTITILL